MLIRPGADAALALVLRDYRASGGRKRVENNLLGRATSVPVPSRSSFIASSCAITSSPQVLRRASSFSSPPAKLSGYGRTSSPQPPSMPISARLADLAPLWGVD
jgi:hypothetical protein